MTRGRKSTPTVLAKLHGNPGRRKLPVAEAKPPLVADFAVPPHLGKDAAAEWRSITKALRDARLISNLDLPLLEAWCAVRADFIQAERALKKTGMVDEDRDGNERRSPWVLIRS